MKRRYRYHSCPACTVKLALFDIDGTLLDNLVDEDACFAQALREQLSLGALDTDWSRYAHVSDDGIITEAYAREFDGPLSDVQRAATIGRFLDLLRSAHHAMRPITMKPGAGRMIAALASRGWTTALATGAWRRAAEYKLAAAGLRVTGVPLATSEDGPARVLIVERAIARATESCGVAEFERVVAIGDGVWDVDAARTLRLPFVGVGSGDRASRLRHAGASNVLANYLDIEAVFHAFDDARVPLEQR